MNVDKQPGIRFNDIILVSECFNRGVNVPKDSELEFDINVSWGNNEENYIVELTTNLKLIANDECVMELENKFAGSFSVIKGQENMDITTYITTNATALMFPYIREHISSITQKSGIKPVLLPPINVVALIKEKQFKGNLTKKDDTI